MESKLLSPCKSSQDRLAERLAMVAIILMAIGTVFVFSAGVTVRQGMDTEQLYNANVWKRMLLFFKQLYSYTGGRQIIFFPMAVIILYWFSYFDYRRLSLEKGLWRTPSTYLLAASVLLLIIVTSQGFFVTLPSLVPRINEHYRWMNIP